MKQYNTPNTLSHRLALCGLAGFLLLFSACFELVNEEYNKIDPAFFPNNEDEADDLIIGNVYKPFSPFELFNSAWGWPMLSFISTDEVEANWSASYIGFEFPTGGYPVTDESRTPVYYYYKFLSKMLLTRERIKDVPMTEERKALMIAQIQCGMGFLAFMEYDLYGPIPLPSLEVLQKPLDDIVVLRATEEEMQTYIETHLLAAAEILPYKWDDNNYGRFTRGLAKTLLMKFYMMMKRWDDAERIGRELLSPEYGYSLVPDYHSLFTLTGEKNSEVIYSMPCKTGGVEHRWHAHSLTSDYPTPNMNLMKWGVYKISWLFYNKYEAHDKRREKIIAEYTGNTGVQHSRLIDRGRADKGGLYYGAMPLKYGLEGTIGEECEIDVPIFRYADVLTLLAEAIVRNNGGAITDEVLELVNRVRRRAGVDPYTLSQAGNPTNFLNLVLEERGREFYMEGPRRQDLIRHGKFIAVNEAKLQWAGILTETRRARINQQTIGNRYDFEKYPIPQGAINEGRGLIIQNPGW
jgi:hypothetical protein